ncbi:putative GIY-YIG endonuclease, structure-specific endonuclease subunit Slx1 [Helianthus annuus]|nr:putative GIY-YIG endonuclease, structure-specific endonuclease subunit Slx1 [Helianthus annuus]
MRKRKGRQSETLIHSNGEQEDDEFRDQRSNDSEDDDKSGFFACYLLTSLCPRYKGHTYIGFTVNPRRRIRQHNGELCSGAWRTKKKRPWEMVLCIHGFPTNVAALQFEWAWQHPVESLAVRNAAVGFKSLGGLANKIKLAYTMLTLPAWNNLNLSVNFFSTKYTKHYAGCPTLPSHMRVHIRSMDELPCYTEGYKDDEDDMFGFENDLSDNEEEPTKSFEDVTIPVLSSINHNNEEEAIHVSGTENYEQSSCDNKDLWDDDKEPETIQVSVSADHRNNENEAICVSDDENNEQPASTNKDMWDDDEEPETMPVHQNDEKEAICVSDDENYEPAACSNIPKRSFMDSGFNKMDCVGDKDGPNTKISGSSGEVEVVDLFTPSPEYRIRKKRAVSVVCPEIIDLTESPICV